MLYKTLVVLHVMGGAVWIGGHVALVRAVLPGAIKQNDPRPVLNFERGFGKVGLAALVIQVITGTWLAGIWVGGWENFARLANPASHLVAGKLMLLTLTLMQAGYAYHRVLPRLRAGAEYMVGAGAPPGVGGPYEDSAGALQSFARHAWITTVLAVLMLVVGALIRLDGH